MAVELIATKHEMAVPVLTRPGYAAPSVILATAVLADVGLSLSFTIRVSSGGTVRVIRFAVQPTAMGADAAITSRALRSIRLDHLAREAVSQLETGASGAPGAAPGTFRITDDPGRIWASRGSVRDIVNPEDQVWASRSVPVRRRAPREQAELAARLYAEARASGSRAPTQSVADQLGYSRSQASRMIRAARDLGLLGVPSDDEKGGDR